jgi:hypothetical protein
MPTTREATRAIPQEIMSALAAWKRENGPRWKSKLRDAWTSGEMLSCELQQARNLVGPSGLDKIKLP